jgi:hypothetical protein
LTFTYAPERACRRHQPDAQGLIKGTFRARCSRRRRKPPNPRSEGSAPSSAADGQAQPSTAAAVTNVQRPSHP